MEEVIFKLAGGNIPKGIYQNMHCSFDIKKKNIPKGIYQNPNCSNDIKKNFARCGSMVMVYLYAL